MRSRLTAIPLIAVAILLLAACAPSAPAASSASPTWPSAIVVLGHSGATGANSDPSRPGEDAKTNSWATGSNPDVDSIYLRALEQSPALKDHVTNVAVSGSNVDDLPDQVQQALQSDQLPDLWIIQSVDNDIQCDGSDDTNYAPYGQKMTAVLQSIVDAAPTAVIYVVGEWSTWQNYADVVGLDPALVAQNEGDSLCDVYDAAGQQRPDAIAAAQSIDAAYTMQLRDACATFPTCVFGAAEVNAIVLTAGDLSDDSSHLTVQGLTKMAAAVWPHIKDLG